MSLELIPLLGNYLVKHTYLKVEDRQVIADICNNLVISDQTEMVNDYFRNQVQIEAGVAYLMIRYSSVLRRLQFKLNEHKAEAIIELGNKTEDGYKWTKQAKEERLMAVDATYVSQLELVSEYEGLVNALKYLHTIVFERHKKLEQLSNNYRQEIKSDKHL